MSIKAEAIADSDTVFIDFLGYGDWRTFLVCREPDKWIWSTSDEGVLKKKIKEMNWKIVPNPRFKNYPAHLEMVENLRK